MMKLAAVALLASTASASSATDLVSTILLRPADGEKLLIDYTLANPTDEAATVLTWNTPLEATVNHPLFDFSGSNATVVYTGKMMKRANEISIADLVTLQPGQSITTTIDLADYYAFESDGEVTAEASFELREVPNVLAKTSFRHQQTATPGFRSLAPEEVRSNPVSFRVGGTRAKQARRRAAELEAELAGEEDAEKRALPVAYVGCSSSQQSGLVTAIANARTMLKNSNAVLQNGSTSSYTKWFENTGTVTSSRYNTIKDGHSTIDAAFDGSYKVDCSTCNSNAYAYVYPTDRSRTIYVCPVYWNAPLGTYNFDSQPGTLIHEMAHFSSVMGTQDYQYGTTGALSLAKSNPDRAIANSDSVEFFNEDKAQ